MLYLYLLVLETFLLPRDFWQVLLPGSLRNFAPILSIWRVRGWLWLDATGSWFLLCFHDEANRFWIVITHLQVQAFIRSVLRCHKGQWLALAESHVPRHLPHHARSHSVRRNQLLCLRNAQNLRPAHWLAPANTLRRWFYLSDFL